MCRFSGYRFRFFSRTGYQKKAIFLEQVVKTCQKGKFVTSGYYLVPFLCFRVHFNRFFSRIGYHLKAKILELDEKICRKFR